ncbi:Phosphonate ABC transporter ATP-binding protein (TC 3.A.1.9.1) [hydrothermal vent metagenome]|uniref:Phosphonate ABC transporter ATP-binding protein (TC 3.A.1.9.1) n=1 Tax=hydrothermal vent metagenome TaxID=652676 RepID=A0A3B0W9N8_9ZZZZ
MSFAFELISADLRYKNVDVLTNINLSIKTGEHVALLGKSGTGKSTLLNYLYQQQRANASMIPQNIALVEALSVFHNVYMGQLNQHGTLYNLLNLVWPQKDEVEKVRHLIKQLNLNELLFNRTGELSGGQKQRVAIARALFQKSQILLGDEPISALDNVLAGKVMKILHDQHETIVLAMHDVKMALCFADRIVGIKNGGIVIDRPTKELSVDDLMFLYEN